MIGSFMGGFVLEGHLYTRIDAKCRCDFFLNFPSRAIDLTRTAFISLKCVLLLCRIHVSLQNVWYFFLIFNLYYRFYHLRPNSSVINNIS